MGALRRSGFGAARRRSREREVALAALAATALFALAWSVWAAQGVPDLDAPGAAAAWFHRHLEGYRLAALLGSFGVVTSLLTAAGIEAGDTSLRALTMAATALGALGLGVLDWTAAFPHAALGVDRTLRHLRVDPLAGELCVLGASLLATALAAASMFRRDARHAQPGELVHPTGLIRLGERSRG